MPPKRRPRSDLADPEAVAGASASAMLARDEASRALGIELVAVGAGWAELTMTVRSDMVNGLDVSHGGLIFTFADTAMAVASNSYDAATFAVAATIDFVRPARRGAVLTARASERHRGRRNAIYDVEVSDAGGQLVATFRGRTQVVGGAVSTP